MADMDIFRQDAFSMVEMVDAFERAPYVPGLLGSLGIFDPVPIRTEDIYIEERDGTLALIQTSERGEAPAEKDFAKRKVRSFRTQRLAKGHTITASEVAGIRAFGSSSELQEVQNEIARRLNGNDGIRADVELTHENMRLGCIMGVVTDADASTIYDWYSEFNISAPAEIAFDLGNASSSVRKKCNQVIRAVTRGLKGAGTPQTRVVGLCGDDFWDDLTSNAEVRSTYLNMQDAPLLRTGLRIDGDNFGVFDYGNITWVNYRGTDDNTMVKVHTDKAKFFPIRARGVFKKALAPAEFFPFVNTPGREWYPMVLPDPSGRQAFVKLEAYSYPLYICTRPEALQQGKRGA